MEWYNPQIRDNMLQFGDFGEVESSNKAFVSSKPKLEKPKSLTNLLSNTRISAKPVSMI